MSPHRSITLWLIGLSGLLASCDLPTVTPPRPTLDQRFVPPAGFWNGHPSVGPWCAAAPQRQDQRQDQPRANASSSAVVSAMNQQELRGAVSQLKPEQHYAAALRSGQPLSTLQSKWPALSWKGQSGPWTLVDGSGQALSAIVGAESGLLGFTVLAPVSVAAPATGLPLPTERGDPQTDAYLQWTGLTAGPWSSGAWSLLEQGCAPVTVAVIDSGWSLSTQGHEFNLTPVSSWFDVPSGQTGRAGGPGPNRSHGSDVGSVIAQMNNGGGEGYAPGYNQVKVLPINVAQADGSISATDVSLAIEYALGRVTTSQGELVNPSPARIINLSLGRADLGSPEEQAMISAQLRRAADAGVLVVAAAGNDAASGAYNYARLEPSLGVGGIDERGQTWMITPERRVTQPDGSVQVTPGVGSNTGEGVDLAAPASNVTVTRERQLTAVTGTSFATPWASSQLALWLYAAQARGEAPLQGEALYTRARTCLKAARLPEQAAQAQGNTGLGAGIIDTARLINCPLRP